MAGESDLADTLAELLAEFDRKNVQYALAGGWAFSTLVEPRATTDIELLVRSDYLFPATIQPLVSSAFSSTILPLTIVTGGYVPIWRCMGLRGRQKVIVSLLATDTPFHRSALVRRRQTTWLGQMVFTVTLEDLMVMKMLAGRLQDQADLERIAQARLQVDGNYIDLWKNKLGLDK